MGVDLGELMIKHEITLDSLNGKKIAVDAYNTLYQFLSIIRQHDGTLLMDAQGRVTSHLSGVFYRNAKLIEAGIKPAYVFDGKPFEMKADTLEERKKRKEEAQAKYEDALKKGDFAAVRTHAQATSRLTKEMVEEAKELLAAMGIPCVQAPSEGEAQAAFMAREGIVNACASQDYDTLLFGAPELARNINITGKRKIPGKNAFYEIHPEMIGLEENLKAIGITREKLIWIGILIGTDFNEGVKGIGPKKALKMVNECGSLEEAVEKSRAFREKSAKADSMEKSKGDREKQSFSREISESRFEFEVDVKRVEEFFLNPPVERVELEFKPPDKQKIFSFLVDKHSFSVERVQGTLDALVKKFEEKGTQSSLGQWFE